MTKSRRDSQKVIVNQSANPETKLEITADEWKPGGSASKAEAQAERNAERKSMLRSGNDPLIHSMNFEQSRETLGNALIKQSSSQGKDINLLDKHHSKLLKRAKQAQC